MVKQDDIKEIISLAKTIEWTWPELDIFEGFYFPEWNDGHKYYASKQQLAKLVRYTALQFNGEFNTQELNDLIYMIKKKIILID